ncbi:MAG: DinB family protein [Bacteroidetes bacterium]|nr:DinB family protein [Bacteroidota bacterium]
MQIMPPPAADFGFYSQYVNLAPKTELTQAMQTNMEEIKAFALGLSEEELGLRYEPGKWSVKENFAHLADAERNFCYRIMRISRGDQGALPPFDIHNFVTNAHADRRDIKDIIAELEHLRAATILMFKGMTAEMPDIEGPARDVMISSRALGYAMVGHTLHHMALIKGKYLAKVNDNAYSTPHV